MPSLIINADDLGVCPETDDGISEAFTKGVLTSTTLLLTTKHTERAVNEVIKKTGLPAGIHLSLTMGDCLAKKEDIPSLVDEKGRFVKSAAAMFTLGTGGEGRAILPQIKTELEAQLARARDWDVDFTHLDSHQNFHMNPAIFAIIEELAPRYGFKKIRLCREPFLMSALGADFFKIMARKNIIKWFLVRRNLRNIKTALKSTDHYFGLMWSGILGKAAFLGYLEAMKPGLTYELATHPGRPASAGFSDYLQPNFNAFSTSQARLEELDFLLSGEARAVVESRGIQLISFRDI